MGTPTQGTAVSLSSDGNTLAVGGINDNSEPGATWIFTRNNNGAQTQQGAKLVGTGNVGTSDQGISVSLLSDENTLAVGDWGQFQPRSDLVCTPLFFFHSKDNLLL